MDYQRAKEIRSQSLSDVIAETIASGGGVGASIKRGISQKSAASMTGLKQTFDPMNIAKFMTGGSKLAPALIGRMTGRSKKDIGFFTGKNKSTDTASKIAPLEKGNELNDVLMRIYSLMKSVNDAEISRREEANQFAEEKALERGRRHKELIEAITGKKYSGNVDKPTAAKIVDDTKSSFLDDMLAAFGLGSTGANILRTLGTFLASPLGLALVGGTLTLTALFKFLKDDPDPEKTNQMIQDMGTPDAAIGREIMDVTEDNPENNKRRKKMNILANRPSDKKSMLFWKDEKLQNEYLKEIGWDEKDGTTQAERDAAKPTNINQKGVTEPSDMNTTKPVNIDEKRPEPPQVINKLSEVPVSEPISGQKLSQLQKENLDLSIPQSKEDPTSVINNNSVKSYAKNGQKVPMPNVRNSEPTFQNMILYSTRVV